MFGERLAKYAHQDTGGAHFVLALYHALLNWATQAAVAILGTIGIAVFVGRSTWLTAACGIVYAALLIGSLICQEYKKVQGRTLELEISSMRDEINKACKQNELLDAVLCDVRMLDSSASSGIFRNARRIKKRGLTFVLSDMREAFGFQTMAMQVCSSIYRTLQEQLHLENHFISVYQRFADNPQSVNAVNGNICKMIAYGSRNGNEPISYSVLYAIPKRSDIKAEDCNDKQKTALRRRQPTTAKYPLHSVIFALNEDRIYALANHKSVNKKFVKHEGAEDREGRIEQYIGIPIKVCESGVAFILQVDSDQKNAFGESEEGILEFAQKYLHHYASLLRFYYEIDRLMETVDGHKNDGGDLTASRRIGA